MSKKPDPFAIELTPELIIRAYAAGIFPWYNDGFPVLWWSPNPRAVLHVSGDNFWAYAVAEGRATLTPAAAEPGDEACGELLEVHSAFYGQQDHDAFFAEMIARRRLVIRLDLDHVYGVIAAGGRRPVPAPAGTGS